MTEYITKEQAIAVVKEAIANIVNSDSETVNLTDLEIEIQMTITDYTDAADVAPVVHARWEGIWGDGYAEDEEGNPQIVYEEFECSNCGQEHLADGEPEWNYCPECGARMDGDQQCK